MGNDPPGVRAELRVAILLCHTTQYLVLHRGDWELGVRAVRPIQMVYIEFSGSDPHSGQVDFTVAEVGADRLVWGGHGPSRPYSTELAKVFDAELTLAQREKIFGGNLRRLAAPIFRKKGYQL